MPLFQMSWRAVKDNILSSLSLIALSILSHSSMDYPLDRFKLYIIPNVKENSFVQNTVSNLFVEESEPVTFLPI